MRTDLPCYKSKPFRASNYISKLELLCTWAEFDFCFVLPLVRFRMPHFEGTVNVVHVFHRNVLIGCSSLITVAHCLIATIARKSSVVVNINIE